MTNELEGRTILFVHPSDELYGADRCLLELVRELAPTTRTIVALPRDVEYDGRLSRELAAAGADVRYVDFAVLRRSALAASQWPKLGRRLIGGTWRLASLARECRADIIHTNTLAAVSGPVSAAISRRRHVWHVHEMIADEHWLVRLGYRLLLLLPGSVIANSKATARGLAGPIKLIRRKTRVVYPGIATGGDTRPPAPPRTSVDRLRVGFVGRLAPRKGVEELLEAIALLRERDFDLSLDVFGSAPPLQDWREGQYRRRADGLGLRESVHFHGFVADVGSRLESIDVLVVPSHRPEPFGLVVLEGMAAGCAVIVSRNGGGSGEILEHGVTGLYCGIEASSIAAAIERLAQDTALLARIGQAGQSIVRNRFSRRRYLEGVLAVYQTILD